MVIKRLFIPYADATFHDHCYIYLYDNLYVSFSVWIIFTKLKYRTRRIRNGHIDLVQTKRDYFYMYIFLSQRNRLRQLNNLAGKITYVEKYTNMPIKRITKKFYTGESLNFFRESLMVDRSVLRTALFR